MAQGFPTIAAVDGSRALPPQVLSAVPGDEAVHATAQGAPMPVAPFNPMAGAREHRSQFSPYELNGGTVLGISGEDYCLVAGDTRLSAGYSILSRDVSRLRKLTDTTVLATGGCHTDVSTLHKMLEMRLDEYEHEHESTMTVAALSQMLGNTLYYRRFFPYYAFNVLCGLDEEGKGAVYTYDAVGSFQRVQIASQGSGQKLIIPLLDNLVERKTRKDKMVGSLPLEEAISIAKTAFITAGEREIYVGDQLELCIITAAGTRFERFDLKKD